MGAGYSSAQSSLPVSSATSLGFLFIRDGHVGMITIVMKYFSVVMGRLSEPSTLSPAFSASVHSSVGDALVDEVDATLPSTDAPFFFSCLLILSIL